MDDEAAFEGEFRSESSLDEDDPRNDPYARAFFPKAQNFVVAGGNFKSTTKIIHVAPPVPSDFRTIPIGDLDLRHETQLDGRYGVVNRWQGRNSVRWVYPGRVHGSKAKMTVVMYQGENAEEEWREDISRNSWLRYSHPSFVQIYATASSTGIHAVIFHDDLTPAENLVQKYGGSHLSMVYLYHHLDTEFGDVDLYMYSIFGEYLDSSQCMILHLNIILILYDTMELDVPSSPASSILQPPEDSKIVESTPLDMYHEICSRYLVHYHKLTVPPDASVSSELDVKDLSEEEASEQELSGNDQAQGLGEDDSSDNLKDEHLSSNECPQAANPEKSNPHSTLGRAKFHRLDDTELEPSKGWKIIMGVQSTLILALAILYLYGSMHSCISIS
ncbi:hypothetical protein DFH09DRAFT_1438583 [Mycena vulgaris]|nr:hypothetical protein DFH09DRAFT_1438583 [Mycena vulgaris]